MSLRSLRNAAVFRSAQARYDAMCPDDDGLTDCPVCDAKGWRMVADEGFAPYREVCPCCDGHRLLDEDGQPYDPKQAERDKADYYADARADR